LQILSSFDPEGRNSPEGEQRWEARRAEPVAEAATGLKRGDGPVRGEPARVVEQKGRTGGKSRRREREVAGRER
jgi:hypothetical protein